MPETTKITVHPLDLGKLIGEMSAKGAIRIPHFQRDYVWERARVAKLFDSIYKGFPIGSFFLWITPREYRKLYKDIPELQLPEPAEYEQIKMILDGQQRVTSLYVTARGLSISEDGKKKKDYKKICFDLDEEKFIVAKRNEDKQRVVAVWRMFDQKGEDEIYDNLIPTRRAAFKKCRRILTSYPLSIVEVEDMRLDDAITIFERINQGGKRLSLFDLVVAGTWSSDFDLKEKVKELNEYFEEIGFGKIDENLIIQTIALLVKGQCTRAFQLQLTNDEIKRVWADVIEAFKLSVDYITENLGVKIYDFIPYPAILTMISYLFAKGRIRALSAQQTPFVKEWFWKAAFSQRYSASTLTLMGNDKAEYFDKVVEGKEVEVSYPISLTKDDLFTLKIHTRSAIKNAILCLLAMKEPRHFINDSVVKLDYRICSDFNNPEKHHIFPKAFLRKNNIKQRHLLLNFTFIPNELNNRIKAEPPGDYLKEFSEENRDINKTLESHLIPTGPNSAIWRNDYESFVQERGDLVFHKIEKLIGGFSPIEVEIEENPDAAVDKIESQLRSFLDSTLTEKMGERWWDVVPPSTQEAVKEKINQATRRHPYETGREISNFERLTYCDFMDYAQIIQKNWKDFSGIFLSTAEVQKHFLNIKEYRNSLKHGRSMNSIIRKQGEASLEWISNILLGNGAVTEEESEEDNSQEEDVVSEYICRGLGIEARAVLVDGKKMKVLKDSSAMANDAPNFKKHNYKTLRDKLVKEGVLKEINGKYIFTVDYTFDSSSAAAAVILARSASGPTEWKTKQGKQLKEAIH